MPSTSNPTQFFGTLNSAGTVAVGKRTDLVLVSDNPLADVRHAGELVGMMVACR